MLQWLARQPARFGKVRVVHRRMWQKEMTGKAPATSRPVSFNQPNTRDCKQALAGFLLLLAITAPITTTRTQHHWPIAKINTCRN